VSDEGVKVDNALDTLEAAKDSLDSGEYDLAMDLIAQSKETAEDLKEGYEKAKLAIEETLTIIEQLADLEVDTIALTEETTHVYDHIDGGDYSEARSKAMDLRERAEDIRKEHFGASIKELSDIVWELGSRGDDTTELKRHLDQIEYALKGRDFEGLHARIQKGHTMVAELMERFTLDTEKVVETEADLKTFEDREIIILEARRLHKEAVDKLEARQYDAIDKLLDEAREAAAKAEEQKGEASDTISRCLEVIDIPFDDIGIEHMTALSVESQEKFDSGQYDEAKVLANNAIMEAKRLQIEYVSMHISECEKLLEEAESEGVNVSPVNEMMSQATEMLKDADYEPANILTEKIKAKVDGLRQHYAEANEKYTRLGEMIEIATSIGIEVENVVEIKGDVDEAFTIPDYETATEMAQQGIELLKGESDQFFTTLVAGIEGAISNAKGDGVPVMRPEELLLEGQGLLDNDQFLDAHRCITQAQESLQSVSERYEGLSGRLKEVQASKIQGAEHGVAIEPVNEELTKIEDALIDARFEDAEGHLTTAEELLNDGWKRTAEARLNETRQEIGNLDELGIQIENINELLEGATSAIEIKEFVEVFTICATAMDMVSEKRGEYESSKSAVNKAREILETVKEIPADLEPCWEALHGAEHSLKEGRLEDAEEGAKECHERIGKVMEGFFGEKLNKVNSDIEEALQTGLKSADLDFAGEVLEYLSNKAYKEAWDILTAGNKMLEASKLEYNEARDALEKSTNLVYEAEEEVDLSSALEFVDQANMALERGDYLATKELAVRATEELWRSVKHYLAGQLTASELMIRKLEIGGDVKLAVAEKVHAEAKAALERDEIDKTRILLKRTVKEAKKARYNYEIANRVITALEMIFTADTINLHILKKGREKAKEAFDKDYEAIIDGAEEAPTVPMAAQLILQYQVKFEESITIDIDVSKGQGLLNQAKAALEDQTYEEAVRLVMECYDTVRESEKMATIRTLISMEEIMIELRDGGLDTSIQANLLERAGEAMHEGDTSRAFKYMHECNESLLTLQQDHQGTLDAMRHAEIAFFIAQHMGVDVQLASDLLASAKTMIEENDFESAKDMSQQGHEELLRSKAEMVNKKQKAVASIIGEAESSGVPMHQARHFLGKSKDLLEAGDHLRAHSYADRAEDRAKYMKEMHGQLKDLVEITNDKIEYARTIGVDVGDLVRLQQKMNNVIATGKHEKVKELSTEIEGDLLTKIIELCNKTISKSQDKLRDAEAIGLMVEELRSELDLASEALEEEDFDTVMDKTNTFNGTVDAMLASELSTRLEKLRTSLEEAERLEISIKKADKRLSEAEGALTDGDHRTAVSIMTELKEDLKVERRKRIESFLRTTKSMIKAGEKQKLEVYSAKGLMEEAKDALEREDVDEAFDFAVQAYNDIKETNLNHINGILTSSKAVVDMAQETGGDTGRVDKLLSKTEDLVAKDNFERAMFYAKQCAREADRLQFKMIQGMISKLEGDMADAGDKEFTIAKELLEDARSSLLTRKYDLSREKILECRDEVKRILEEPAVVEKEEVGPAVAQLENEAAELLASAELIISELRNAGADTSQLDELFDEALKAMEDGDFVAAMDNAEQILEQGNAMKAELEARPPKEEDAPEEEVPPPPELEGKAAGIMDAAQDLILDVKGEGLLAEVPDETLKAAREAMEKKDYQTAIDLARRSLDESNTILSGEEPPAPKAEPEPPTEPDKPAASEPPPELEKLLNTVRGNIDDASKIGIKVDDLLEKVAQALTAIDEGKFQDADVVLKDIDGQLTERLQKFKGLNELVTKVDDLMTIAATYSFNISQAQQLYQQGLGLRGSDPEQANAMLTQAQGVVLKVLEGVYPYLTVDLVKDKTFIAGIWNETFIYVSNTGNIYATDLKVEVLGAEVDGEQDLAKVDIGETKELKIKLRPAGVGEQVLKLRVTFIRDFDERTYVAEFPQNIVVKAAGSGGSMG